MKKNGSFLLRIFNGILIGATGIIPGASGGIIAVALGEYQPSVEALYDFIRHPKQHFKSSFLFLLPLGIGIVAGILGCSFLLEYLLLHYAEPLTFALIGMVAGGVPALIRQGNKEAGFRPRYILCILLGAALISMLSFLDREVTGGEAWPLNAWTAMLGGGIIVVGVVIPGISTSFVLMYMGLYVPMLAALTSFNIPILFSMGLGALLVGGVLFLIVRQMFHQYSSYTYYVILGFLIGTIYLIFPGFSAAYAAFDLILLLGGLAFVLFTTRDSNK